MALFGGGPMTTNGVTAVTAVAAPASGKQREVLSCFVDNLDTISHIFKQRHNKATVMFDLPNLVLAAGQRGQLAVSGVVLDATDESYEVLLGEAIGTTQPKICPAYFEVP